jgi:hypothetical protein
MILMYLIIDISLKTKPFFSGVRVQEDEFGRGE